MKKKELVSLPGGLAIGATLITTLIGYGRRVYADCSGSSGTYVCSGSLSSTETLTGSPLIITTDPNFSINVTTTGDNAFNLTGTGGLSFTDIMSSTITGNSDGINAYKTGFGDLSITTTGDVTGTNNDGIHAYKIDSGNLKVSNLGTVNGGRYGIFANNGGNGNLVITNSGTVTGNSFGIKTTNASLGSSTITSTGLISSELGGGIYASLSGANLTITAHDITAFGKGIEAKSLSSSGGHISITSTGTILSSNEVGVYVSAAPSSPYVDLDLNNVTGYLNGIEVFQYNLLGSVSGNLHITTRGSITSTTSNLNPMYGNGIYLNYITSGSMAITIDSGSSVSGHNAAIRSISGTPLTITNNGNITGAISLSGVGNSITNNGTWGTAGVINEFGASGANSLINGVGGIVSAVNSSAITVATTHFNGLTTFNNAGTINLRSNAVGNQLVITGNFVGNDGSVLMNATLGDDASPTDNLVLNGGTASGTTNLEINNVGGGGALTTGNGILVVDAENGATTTANAFKLGKRVAAGAYEYNLYQGGAFAGPASGNTLLPGPETDISQSWFLRSTSLRDEIPLTMTAPLLAQQFGITMVDTLDDRVGSKVRDPNRQYHKGGWLRFIGQTGDRNKQGGFNNFVNNGPMYHWTIGGVQIGYDLYRNTNEDQSSNVVGVDFGYGQVNADVQNATNTAKAGDMRINGFAFAGYWTHYASQGWYTDAVLQATDYDGFNAKSVGGESLKTNGSGYLASLESGWKIKTNHHVSFIPEAQIIYQQVLVSNFADGFGMFNFNQTHAAVGRLGGRVSKNWSISDKLSQFTTWGRVNVWHDFNPQTNITFLTLAGSNPVALNANFGGNWMQYSLGALGQLPNGVSLFASGDYSRFFSSIQGDAWSGRVGLKYVR